MDEAVGGLEIEFKRVVNDLEYVSHHLEKEFRSRQASSGESDVVALIRRISALESNLMTTKKRSEKLLSHRQQVTSMSASIMLSNHARLSRLLEEFGRGEDHDNAHLDLLDVDEDKENGPGNIGVNGDHNAVDNNDRDDSGMNHTNRMKMDECREVRQELLEVLKECTFVTDPSKLSMMGCDHDGTAGARIPAAASSSGHALLPPRPPLTASSSTNNSSGSGAGPLSDPSSTRPTPTTTQPLSHISTHPINSNAPFDAPTTTTATASTKSQPSTSPPVAPFDLITVPQFEGVSSSTRGRCKLTDCQALLTRLVAHYTTSITTNTNLGHKKTKKGGGSATAGTSGSSLMLSLQSVPVLSLAELGAMGLKVAQTLTSLGHIPI